MNDQAELRQQVEEDRKLLDRLFASRDTQDFTRLFAKLAFNFEEGTGNVSVLQVEDSWAIAWQHEGTTYTIDTGYGALYDHLVEVWPLALLVEADLVNLGHGATIARLNRKGFNFTCT